MNEKERRGTYNSVGNREKKRRDASFILSFLYAPNGIVDFFQLWFFNIRIGVIFDNIVYTVGNLSFFLRRSRVK